MESVRKKRLADMTSDEKNDYTKRSKNFENKSHARKRNNPEICNYVKIETRWQYFATSHGKGIVDGIGGAAKSCVRRRVMRKKKRHSRPNCGIFFPHGSV